MSKYDFKLDLTGNNSLKMIIERIRPNSVILEFGPAEGRLTRYLSESMGCQMTIVEIDEEAYAKARIYAVDGMCCDIEQFEWFEYLRGKKFDYIIFADVLEHLKRPDVVLKAVSELLKSDGSVLTSIPNIGHNKVLVKLYQNQFDYTNVGLLDNTHIRFWGYENLEKYFDEIGYGIVYQDVTNDYAWTGDQEVDPGIINEQLFASLQTRYLGNAYQFILECKEKQYCIENKIRKEIGKGIQSADQKKVTVFYDYGEGFQAENYEEFFAEFQRENHFYMVTIPIREGTKQVRFDPVEGEKIYCRILMAADTDGNTCEILPMNGYSYEGMDVFDHTDPQYLLKADSENEKAVTIVYKFNVIGNERVSQIRRLISASAEIEKIRDTNVHIQKHNEDLERAVQEQGDQMKALNDQLRIARKAENFCNEVIADLKVKGDEKVRELTRQLDEALSANQVLREESKKFRSENQELSEECKALQNRNIGLEDTNEGLRSENNEIQKINRELQDSNFELQKINEDLRDGCEFYRQKFEAISDSSFWRVSKPIRMFLDKIKGIK